MYHFIFVRASLSSQLSAITLALGDVQNVSRFCLQYKRREKGGSQSSGGLGAVACLASGTRDEVDMVRVKGLVDGSGAGFSAGKGALSIGG